MGVCESPRLAQKVSSILIFGATSKTFLIIIKEDPVNIYITYNYMI